MSGSNFPQVCLLRGDGIGSELLAHARRALEFVLPGARIDEAPIGFHAFEATGSALPPASAAAARDAEACLLVAVGSPLTPTPGYKSPIVALRQELDLFANLRPVQSLPASGSPGVDLLIVRENTEGLYSGIEHADAERAVAERVVTATASRRIARLAGELATSRRGRVTVVHKANVLRETCGLFRSVALDELANFPELDLDELLVDNAALCMASEPERFDVVVTTNLFGDILSDVAALAGGGLGLVTSANLGESSALFEPVHGSAPDLVGSGRANPVATLRAVAWLARHLGALKAAERLHQAIEHSLTCGPRTPDIGGHASTEQVVEAILSFASANKALTSTPH